MNRPGGVTATAVIQILGSTLCLLFVPLMIFASRQPDAPPEMQGIGIGISLMYGFFGALGIVTAIGLLKMKQWARVSTLVFAGFMAFACVMAAIGVMLVPPPPPPSGLATPVPAGLIMRITAAIMLIPAFIGIWWLVYFTRPAVRDAFAAGTAGTPSARPLSVSIIGWWYVVGGVLAVAPALIRLPAYFFGAILTGWSASLVYVAMGGIGAALGWELLKLREQARVLMLGWMAFSGAHTLFMYVVPGQLQRMQMAMQAAIPAPPVPTQSPFLPIETSPVFAIAIMAPMLILLAVAAYFLVKHKPAFTKAA